MAASAPSSQREIRRRNLSRVLYAVAEPGPSSRAAVATRLGLTRTAVSTLVDELLRGGLLTEQGPTPPDGGPGRPGTALALTDSGPCGLGAEIGVDHLAVCAVDLRGRVRAREDVESEGRSSEPGAVLDRLRGLVDTVAAQARGHGLSPAALTVAVPGLIARGTSSVVRAPNLGWRDVDIAPALASAGASSGSASGSGSRSASSSRAATSTQPGTGTRPGPEAGSSPLPITADNEANLAALAELWLDSGRVPRDFVHVSAEVGIGAAIVLDGELLRGTRGFAGEIGHVPVRPDGPPCACGGKGCLEQYAGEWALLRAAGAPVEGPRDATLAALRERAAAGDERALRALQEAGTALGLALAGTVNLLDPGALVLGGVLARFAPWLLPSLERELTERTAAPGAPPDLVVSGLGADGPLLGAAHAAVRVVLDDPLSYRTEAAPG
ncbi:ROK family transcriptional regulator [Streptomyces spirodelae]|uniref:ROK family transcriptional regulator n=1 Tax=Streptomyces spirodelae TaxID=2812904 RepID=A0ABS3X3D8_9ACTN|nr:ROK family transcriptional regulator [Streptomyces spirodelae]MBO8189621.1 ROK family transcriptional regulator [Streptomyces spirodelae]